MRWLQGAENMKEQPKTTEEKKKIKQGFCSLRSPVYAQISERQDLSLCLSCFPFFLSASHKDKKLVFCVVFLFIYCSWLSHQPPGQHVQGHAVYTHRYIHTHTLICKLLHTVWFHSKPEKNVAYICTTCTPQDTCANLRITQWATGPYQWEAVK